VRLDSAGCGRGAAVASGRLSENRAGCAQAPRTAARYGSVTNWPRNARACGVSSL
jgi:hypothetical protein